MFQSADSALVTPKNQRVKNGQCGTLLPCAGLFGCFAGLLRASAGSRVLAKAILNVVL